MDSAQMHDRVRTAESVRETINQDGAVLLDIKQGVCFSMNPLGAKIWEMLKKEYTVDQIASFLEGEFQVPRRQIELDIAEFLENLKARKLINIGNDANAERPSWLKRIFPQKRRS